MSFNSLNEIALHKALLELLPNTLHAGNAKNDKSNYMNKYVALKHKFIRYNTKKFISILIFDDDETKIKDIEKYQQHIKDTINLTPSFITQTTKGFHFAFILDNLCYTDSPKYLLAKEFKKVITKKLNLDPAASHRMIGIWRNPLEHTYIFNDVKHNMIDLSNMFNISIEDPKVKAYPTIQINKNTRLKMSENTPTQQTIKKGFYKGNRNNYLFAVGFRTVFEDRSAVDNIEEILQQVNASQPIPGLTKNEVTAIAASIVKIAPTMYNFTPRQKRGKLSDIMWAKKIHGLYNRRVFAANYTNIKRRENIIDKLSRAYISLFELGKTKPKNKEVYQASSVSIRTIQRYKTSFNPLDIFRLWIKNTIIVLDRQSPPLNTYRKDLVNKLIEFIKEAFLVRCFDTDTYRWRRDYTYT